MKKPPRNLTIQSIPLRSTDRFLKLCLSYDAGGINYFTGESAARGYYLSTRLVTLSGGMEIYEALSGYRKIVESAEKFSQKKLASLAEVAASLEFLPGMIASTLAKTGEQLA